MVTAKSMKELEKLINKQYLSVAMRNVAKTAKNIQQQKAVTEVYDTYEPYEYERRGSSGGIADQRNMIDIVKSNVKGTSLSIENITKGKDDPSVNVAALVEYGDDNGYGEYDYKTNRDDTSENYLKPRTFQKETMKELIGGQGVASLAEGLKQQGLTVK